MTAISRTNIINWQPRLRAAGVHLLLSAVIAAVAAVVVFAIWYPYPYREISGGRELFLLVVSVDVILGPLITLTIFDRRKSTRELVIDLAIVAAVQLSALSYGLWTVFVARPVHLVFEIDRFRIVHAVDVPAELLSKTPPEVDALPLTGPTLLAVRPFKDAAEKFDATMAALGGAELGARPDFWQPYSQAQSRVLAAAKPVTRLKQRFPAQSAQIEAVLHRAGRTADTMAYLPVVGRKSFWTAFVDPTNAGVVAFMPLDSFE
jgi:hypothetical protein